MSTERDNTDYETYISLLSANQRRIQGFIYAMIAHHAAAEDIMQETMLIMWKQFDRFQEGSNFSAWGIGIARNLIRQYFQSKKRKAMHFDSSALENLMDQSDVFGSTDDQTEALRHCVKRLDAESRELLKMRYVQEHSVLKIAEQVNRTTSHLYRVISKIHNALLKCMQSRLTKVNH